MLRCVLVLGLAIELMSTTAWAYSGGTGKPNDPYQIATAQDLIELGQEHNDYNDCFVLTADIDLSGYTFDRAVIAPDVDDTTSSYPSSPSHQGTKFKGTFDGNGHIISHLLINGQDYLGFFGDCSFSATISNLGLEAVEINGTGSFTGGLVGWNDGIITSSYTSGSVNQTGHGGSTGGLVGVNGSGSITLSYSTCSARGSNHTGGLVGWNYHGTITSSYSTGAVNGGGHAGGLVGYIYSGSITSSYSTGSVNGEFDVGGLVGHNLGGNITSSFWDTESSGQNASAGGTGLATSQMQRVQTYIDAGWDLVGETAHGTCNFWVVQEGAYPSLAVFSGSLPAKPNGSGTLDDPYLLTDANNLGTVCYRPWAYYRLEANIDLNGITWNSAVVPIFGGFFDGNGHMISNLSIDGGGYLGLFGYCTSGAIISNLGLEAVDVNGTGDYIGGLVGENSGTISSCYSNGDVSGTGRYVGGLVGENGGTISSCYSNGDVSGTGHYVGGLVGENYYGSIASSFWDIQTSGQSTSYGGTGLTTTQLQSLQTYIDAGWDLVGETAHGTCNFWVVQEGAYPSLAMFSGSLPAEPNGSGTQDDPFLLTDANDLGSVWMRPWAHYRLDADIDLEGITWNSAVVPGFKGFFDGNGHVIFNLRIDGVDYLGLFGTCVSGSVISSLGLESVDVNGTGSYIGALAAQNNGSIMNCQSDGSISGKADVGGLVGYNQDTGTISLCHTAGTVTGQYFINSVAGRNDGTISKSTSTAIVEGNPVGGGR